MGKSKTSILWVSISIFIFAFGAPSSSQDKAGDIPEDLMALIGSYNGEWTAYGIDDSGRVVEAAGWIDTITMSDPVNDGNRVYAKTTDIMYFDGGHIPPMTVTGIEGYILNEDGSPGDYFFEMYGQVYHMYKLNENTWVYVMPASPQEMMNFGFTDLISAQHISTKVVTNEDGIETHRINRITTVNWKDKSGEEKWIQYNSLEGFHKRLQ